MPLLPLFHVIAGTGAVLSGTITLIAPKGRVVHIMAGRVFVVLMLACSVSGAVLGLLEPESFFITFHAGLLTLYLIVSGWLAARKARGPAWVLVAAAILNLGNLAGLLTAGANAMASESGLLFGFPAQDYFFLSTLSLAGALGDVHLAIRRRLTDKHRTIRHLWRMCLAFFIAAGSAFTGPGAKAFPQAIRDSGLLSLPELSILALLIFWIIRTLFRKAN